MTLREVKQAPFRGVVLVGLVRDLGTSACLKSFLYSSAVPWIIAQKQIHEHLLLSN